MPGYGVVTLHGVAQPALNVTLGAPGSVTLSWAQAAAGFLLQSAETLTPPKWLADTNSVAISNNIATLNAVIGNGRFYRLVLP